MTDTDERHLCGGACQQYQGSKIPADRLERIFYCLEFRGLATITISKDGVFQVALTEQGLELAKEKRIWE